MNAMQMNVNLQTGEEMPESSETYAPDVPTNHTYNFRHGPIK